MSVIQECSFSISKFSGTVGHLGPFDRVSLNSQRRAFALPLSLLLCPAVRGSLELCVTGRGVHRARFSQKLPELEWMPTGTYSTLDSLRQPEVQVLLNLLITKPSKSGIQRVPPPETLKAELCLFFRMFWRALSGSHRRRSALVLGSMYLCHVLCQLLPFPRTPF